MAKPDWFILIEQWKPQHMGDLGPTLPFLVGAIAYKREQKRTGLLEIQALLDEIVYHPMDGYSTVVVWCRDIGAPVLNLWPVNSPYIGSSGVILRPSGTGASVFFGENLQGRWNSEDGAELLNLLLQDAAGPVSAGKFSRRPFEYEDFPIGEIEYINCTIIHPNRPE
jgi:hypothetical protein